MGYDINASLFNLLSLVCQFLSTTLTLFCLFSFFCFDDLHVQRKSKNRCDTGNLVQLCAVVGQEQLADV